MVIFNIIVMGYCKQICKKLDDVRHISRTTGHLPRCLICGFAYSEDMGQVRCECCNKNLRRSRR